MLILLITSFNFNVQLHANYEIRFCNSKLFIIIGALVSYWDNASQYWPAVPLVSFWCINEIIIKPLQGFYLLLIRYLVLHPQITFPK